MWLDQDSRSLGEMLPGSIAASRLRSRYAKSPPPKAIGAVRIPFILLAVKSNRCNAMHALPMRDESRGMSTGRLDWRLKSSRQKSLSVRTLLVFRSGSKNSISSTIRASRRISVTMLTPRGTVDGNIERQCSVDRRRSRLSMFLCFPSFR